MSDRAPKYLGYVSDRDYLLVGSGVIWYIQNPPTQEQIDAAEIAAAAKAISDAANTPASRPQLRRALQQLGQLSAVDTLLSGNADWTYNQQFTPRDPVITLIRKGLKKPYSFMDQAFRLARTL